MRYLDLVDYFHYCLKFYENQPTSNMSAGNPTDPYETDEAATPPHLSTGHDPYDVDDEGYMILSTDDFAGDNIEWPLGTEAPSKYCECMIPDVKVYLGLNKSVEYCAACQKDMPPGDEQ